MTVQATDAPRLDAAREGGWWFRQWAGSRVTAGITNRRVAAAAFLAQAAAPAGTVEAEQVHGTSLAAVEQPTRSPLPGCDGLMTARPGLALLIRTADCLPVFFTDPLQGVVGLAHAGWRGVAAGLPARMVAGLRHYYHSRPEALQVAIGPAIRACCYEVGPEFARWFEPFLQTRGGRTYCDLIGATVAQLRQAGVRPERLLDSGVCTACHLEEWFSLRREGAATGRLTSVILAKA